MQGRRSTTGTMGVTHACGGSRLPKKVNMRDVLESEQVQLPLWGEAGGPGSRTIPSTVLEQHSLGPECTGGEWRTVMSVCFPGGVNGKLTWLCFPPPRAQPSPTCTKHGKNLVFFDLQHSTKETRSDPLNITKDTTSRRTLSTSDTAAVVPSSY